MRDCWQRYFFRDLMEHAGIPREKLPQEPDEEPEEAEEPDEADDPADESCDIGQEGEPEDAETV